MTTMNCPECDRLRKLSDQTLENLTELNSCATEHAMAYETAAARSTLSRAGRALNRCEDVLQLICDHVALAHPEKPLRAGFRALKDLARETLRGLVRVAQCARCEGLLGAYDLISKDYIDLLRERNFASGRRRTTVVERLDELLAVSNELLDRLRKEIRDHGEVHRAV